MRKYKKIIVWGTILGLLGCGTTHKGTMANQEEKQALETLMASGEFEINPQWARPLATSSLNAIANSGLLAQGSTTTQINLTGYAAYFRVIGDSVSAYLPYYGERHMVTGYGTSNSAIQFAGVAEDFELVAATDKQGYRLNFSLANGTESYSIAAKILPGMYSTINVNSSHRLAISYTGEVAAYSKE